MLPAPIPTNDETRLEALREHLCAYVPHEERFDAITRTVCEMLEVPISLVSIVEQDEQWFRSMQGISADRLPRETSFCGHAVASQKLLSINDTLHDVHFQDNPLMLDAPHIRAYLGHPLEIMPGLVVGTLCAIDTRPRNFTAEDIHTLKTLAGMVEVELRLVAVSDLQAGVLSEMDADERQSAIDPLTGCWNAQGLTKLLHAIGKLEATKGSGMKGKADGLLAARLSMALCHIQVHYTMHPAIDGNAQLQNLPVASVAQQLRQRLALHNALACTGTHDFYALLMGESDSELAARQKELLAPVAGAFLQSSSIALQPGMNWEHCQAALHKLNITSAVA